MSGILEYLLLVVDLSIVSSLTHIMHDIELFVKVGIIDDGVNIITLRGFDSI